MTQSGILITTHTKANIILEKLSSYFRDHGYQVTHELVGHHLAWIPVITPDCRCEDIDTALHILTTTNENIIIVPLLLHNISYPTALESRFAVNIEDDTADFQPYFAGIKEHIVKGQRLLDKLTSLNTTYQHLQQQAPPVANSRFNHYLQELRQHIDLTRRAVQQPRIVHEANQTAITAGIQALLDKSGEPSHSTSEHRRTVGNPPQGRSQAFRGRETEIASISNYLLDDSDTRVISILGRGGVGKTALACHVLDTLIQHQQVYAVLYLSAESRTQDFTLERLFMMTGEALGDDARDMLDRVWKNDKMALETRIDYLIDQYVDERCLLLFDNLEDSLTNDGQFVDRELDCFFKQFLSREHQATILVTSRIAVKLDDSQLAHARIVPLSLGLSEPYAIELLHDFDREGTLGLYDADKKLLSDIVKYTKGYPRALEAIAGILANQPRITLSDLISDDEVFDDEDLISEWVIRAESVLDADQRMVMQALAIFARPVNETAIRFLLDPFVEISGIDIPFTLARLSRGRYITRNHISGDISIHPLDKDYNYNLIKEGEADIGKISAGERFLRQMNILPPLLDDSADDLFTRFTLEKRAGDYYAQLRRQPTDWQTIHDLQPYFLEYEHRLRAHDYETSFTMLITIYNLLKLSGFSRKIIEMIAPLIEKLTDTYLMTCYNMLGMAYDDLGRYQEALDCHLTALPLAQAQDNRPAEAAHLSGIGLQYSNLGQYDRALENYERALGIAQETGKRKQERGILNNMAVVYNSIGRKLEGLTYYEESLKIAREIEDRQGIAVTLANIGDSYGALGNVDKTIACYQESIEHYSEIGDKLGRGVTVGKLGNAAIMLGSYEDALKLLKIAVGIAQAVGNRMWDVLHQADIAAVFTHQGEFESGLTLLEELIPQALEISNPILVNYTHSLLAGVLVYKGEFERALTASEIAIKYVNPANRHYEYALYGLILVRLNRMEEARDAFYVTLDHAAELLENTANLYSPKYSRGLALMGLALVTNDMTYAEDAKSAYIEARKNCDAKGIVIREMKKLKLLTGSDNDEGEL